MTSIRVKYLYMLIAYMIINLYILTEKSIEIIDDS